MKTKFLFYLLFFFFSFNLFAQPEAISPNTRVSVITCGQGGELYSLFWHTALRFSDPEQNLDVVFNYGTFDFNTPDFYAKFVKGDLNYHLSVDQFQRFVWNYKEDNRSIEEQVLNLTPVQKQKIWSEVVRQIQTEDRFYTYKFIDNNCTTKVVDLLEDILEEPLPSDFEENRGSYRSILNAYLENNYFEKLGINLIFGSKTDMQNHHVFLPDKLWISINKAQNGSQPLLEQNVELNTVNAEKSNNLFNNYWFFLIICVGISFGMKFPAARKIWFFLLGVLGVFFISVGWYSLHKEVLMNDVVLFCNPLYLMYIFIWSKKVKKIFLYVISGCLLVYLPIAGLEKIHVFSPLLLVTIMAIAIEYKYLFPRERKV